MSLAIVIKLLHVLSAMWLVSGLLGRRLAVGQAAQATNIHTLSDLVKLGGQFEQRMVIPGSSAVFLLGLATAWLQGWPMLGFLQGANSNWLLVAILLFLTLIPIIVFVFVPRGRIFDRALEKALAQEQVTPELSAAFADRPVYVAHVYELVIMAVIIILMVTKPF